MSKNGLKSNAHNILHGYKKLPCRSTRQFSLLFIRFFHIVEYALDEGELFFAF